MKYALTRRGISRRINELATKVDEIQGNMRDTTFNDLEEALADLYNELGEFEAEVLDEKE